MASNNFNNVCAETQIQASNLSVAIVQDCMGDSDADEEHALLKVRELCSARLSNLQWLSMLCFYRLSSNNKAQKA